MPVYFDSTYLKASTWPAMHASVICLDRLCIKEKDERSWGNRSSVLGGYFKKVDVNENLLVREMGVSLRHLNYTSVVMKCKMPKTDVSMLKMI